MHGNRENIIRRAVKESIDEFVKSNNRGDKKSLRIEGNIPDAGKYIKTFMNLDQSDILDEGLIKTYPIDATVNHLIREYGLLPNQVQIRHMNNGITKIDFICVILPKDSDSNMVGEIKHDMRTCGYFINQKSVPINGGDFFMLVFEPKYNENVSDIIRLNYKYLLHLTSRANIDAISTKGLIPRSKNRRFSYPDRIYFMLGDKLSGAQFEILLKVINSGKRTKISQTLNTPDDYALLTIDLSKVPLDVKFYYDPMSYEAVFTYDNIPPSAIVRVEPFNENS